MRKRGLIAVGLLVLSAPAWAKTHSDIFPVPCMQLWPAVKDTLRNSGKYGIIGIDNSEMTASYNIGGTLTGKRINSLVLNSKGPSSCELQVQTAYSGVFNNDEGDFKKRVTESLAKLSAGAASPASAPSPAPASGTPPAGASPAAPPPTAKP